MTKDIMNDVEFVGTTIKEPTEKDYLEFDKKLKELSDMTKKLGLEMTIHDQEDVTVEAYISLPLK